MKTVTTFFATRTAARNAVEALNGKVKDFGTDAPKGERWGVIHEVLETAMEEQSQVQEKVSDDEIKAEIALLARSVLNHNSTMRVISRRRVRHSQVQNLKGKVVPVTTYYRNAA